MQYIFMILGFVIIGLGIYSKVHSNRMHRLGITRAVVHDCQPAVKKIGQLEIPCSRVTFEIPTVSGMIYSSMLVRGRYNVGDIVDVFYDRKKDKVELPENVSEKGSKGPYLVMAFGALISGLLILFEIAKRSAAFNDALMFFLSYAVAFALIFGSIYLGVIKPKRRLGQMFECHTVPGTLVDYTKRRRSGNTIYYPIYEYEHNGELVRIDGEHGGNGSHYRNIGRKVTIVINYRTGETYCLEEVKEIKKGTIVIGLFGVLVLALLIAKDFFGLF